MKKSVVFALAALMLCTTACGSSDDDSSSVNESNEQTTSDISSTVESEDSSTETDESTDDSSETADETSDSGETEEAETDESRSYIADTVSDADEGSTDIDFSQITLGDTTVVFGETTLMDLLEGGWGFAGDYAQSNNDYWLTAQLDSGVETYSFDYNASGIELYSSTNDCTIYVSAANLTDETINATDGAIVYLHNNIVANVNDSTSYGSITPIDGLSYKTSQSDVFKIVGENYISSYSRSGSSIEGQDTDQVQGSKTGNSSIVFDNEKDLSYIAYVYKNEGIYGSFFIGSSNFGLCGFEFALEDYYTQL